MDNQHIKKQLRKFSLYGLFKNLKFFDPFLWVYLVSNGLDITYIGILVAIRELIIYVFEIPSGVFADKFGKKNELVLCFIFYIVSFILFFIGGYFIVFVLAFIAYGFGEAFRSGTHKAMIMEFLDYHELKEDKSKIYGLTRSYSMIGSTMSSLLSVAFVIWLPDLRLLFLFSIVPYVIDLFLILSYPEYLNLEKDINVTMKDFFKGITVVIFYTLKRKKMRRTLIDSAMYNAIFKSIKDFIQPIIISFMVGIIIFTHLDQDGNSKVILGLIYAGIFIISAITSKNSHKVQGYGSKNKILYFIWLLSAILFLVLGYFVHIWYVVIFMFILIYVLQNIRKPLMVQKIGDCTDKDKRASVLSVESQITSLFIIVLAPTLAFVYDHFGPAYIFYFLAMINVVFFIVERNISKEKVE